jgi:hypothetical protein
VLLTGIASAGPFWSLRLHHLTHSPVMRSARAVAVTTSLTALLSLQSTAGSGLYTDTPKKQLLQLPPNTLSMLCACCETHAKVT